jgi:hypothetical protein
MRRSEETVTSDIVTGSTPVDGFGHGSSIGRALRSPSQFFSSHLFMSKWNQVISPSKPDTENRAGGEAFTETAEVALVNLVLTSFMKDKFYEAAKDEQARLTGLLTQVDPQFAAKAAIYARKRFGMRSITHFTSAWIAKNVHGST